MGERATQLVLPCGCGSGGALDSLWVWVGNSNTHATYGRTYSEVLVCYAAFLALHLSDDMLDEVNKTLISKLQQKNIKADAARTYVQTIGAVRSHPCSLPVL